MLHPPSYTAGQFKSIALERMEKVRGPEGVECPLGIPFVCVIGWGSMLVALTGTPGTGKSTVAAAVRTKGWNVLEVNELARRHGLLRGKDPARDSYEVDPEELQEALGREGYAEGILVGHLAHLLDVDMVIVLRCRPEALAVRLERRGWPAAKIRENVLAEALDIILAEAMGSGVPVFEVDTTGLGQEETAEAVLAILAGEREKYAAGNIDWSEEALRWS